MEFSSEYVSDEYLRLNHCGVQYLWDRDYVRERPNGRRDYHILYIHQGICHTEIRGEAVAVEAGNLILFRPGEPQRYRFYKKDQTISCYIHFTGSGCDDLLRKIGLEERRILPIGISKTVFALYEKLEMEATLQNPFSDMLCASYITEILAHAARKSRHLTKQNQIPSRIDTVCQFLYKNYAREITTEECAKLCNWSVSRFSHLFKESTGKTPGRYLTEIRISRAKELLSSYDYSISEIAEKTGFANQNYFARVFRQYTGLSPKKYKLQNR